MKKQKKNLLPKNYHVRVVQASWVVEVYWKNPTCHIVPCEKFHRIRGAPPETFSSEKYDAPEEVGGDR